MTRFGDRVIEAKTLSQAWLETVQMVARQPKQVMFHTVTTITDPLAEDDDIRNGCASLLEVQGKSGIETVANTIFPAAAMAATSIDSADLVNRYRRAYPTIRRFPNNHSGTYFGRFVSYPGAKGDIGRLGRLIDKLKRESANDRPKTVRYEVNLATVEDQDEIEIHEPGSPESIESGAGEESSAATVIRTERDNSPMGFPCLSMYSFQLDSGRVHLLAHYRYEYLIAKGYGNYLGLARLLSYVATAAGLEVGQLTIVTGRAKVDAAKKAIESYLNPALPVTL